MSKSVPASPDYTGAAEAQAASSRDVTEQQTWANRPTVNTPFGQQTWSTTPVWDPSTGQYLNTWEMNTNLTPESQAALDAQQDITAGRSTLAQGLLGRAQDEFGEPMDWDNFTPLTEGVNSSDIQMNVGDTPDYDQRAEDALYGKFSSRMDPQFQRESEAKRTQLYNSGLREGDEAYDQAMKELSQNQNDAREQAQYQAIIGGGAEAQRMQGMDIAAGGFANSAANQALNQQVTTANYGNTVRQQQISEEMQRRGLSLNEINAILSGQQVGMPSMPGFNSAQRSEATQYNQAAQSQGQYNIDQFNAQQQATQGLMQGATGAMMLSDRRLKKNVVQWSYDPVRGLWNYFYNYVWEKDTDPHHYGYMADEVEKLYPAAVVNVGGFKAVNYGFFDA